MNNRIYLQKMCAPLLTLVMLAACSVKQPVVPHQTPDSGYLADARRVGLFYLGPQPQPGQLDTFADAGIATVINFRTREEMQQLDFNPSSLLADADIDYLMIETGGEQHPFDRTQLQQFIDALEDHPRPMVLHCRSGFRAGVVLAAWLIDQQGLSMDEALQEVGDERISETAVLQVLGQ